MTKKLLWILIFGVLQACATSQLPPTEPEWGFQGKFSFRSPEKNQSGNIVWKQYSPQQFEAKLWGTLGLGTTIITGNRKGVTVDNGKESIFVPIDQTVEIAPGLRLPFGQLGQQANDILLNADPHSPIIFGDQQQWQAQTLSSVSYTGFGRPTKIRLSNTEANTRVKLIIGRWF